MAGHTKWYNRTLPLCDFEIFSAISQISPFLCTSLAQRQAPGNSVRLNMPGHTWNDMPVDSYELIAKGAPRPVFISAGEKGDGWVEGRGMFMAAVGAGPVYKLSGKKIWAHLNSLK